MIATTDHLEGGKKRKEQLKFCAKYISEFGIDAIEYHIRTIESRCSDKMEQLERDRDKLAKISGSPNCKQCNTKLPKDGIQ